MWCWYSFTLVLPRGGWSTPKGRWGEVVESFPRGVRGTFRVDAAARGQGAATRWVRASWAVKVRVVVVVVAVPATGYQVPVPLIW